MSVKMGKEIAIGDSFIDFGNVCSDNFHVAASLAEVAILNEKISLTLDYHEKNWNNKTIQFMQEINSRQTTTRIRFSPSKRLFVVSHESVDIYGDNNPAFSKKVFSTISLADFYCELNKSQADLIEILDIKKEAYGSFLNRGNTHLERIEENRFQFEQASSLEEFQKKLQGWFLSGYPHRYREQNLEQDYMDFFVRPPALVSSDCLPMSFLFMESQSISMMRVDKLILVNPYGPPTKIYLPLTNWGGSSLHPEAGILLKLPFPDKQPLYNLPDIRKATSVVLCASMEDASCLKKANAHQTDVAFTSFNCDTDCSDEVDFIPIDGKKLYMLISNQSGRSPAEEYLETYKVYRHLHQELGEKVPIMFIHREVVYPDIGIAENFEAVFKAYRSNPPRVRKCELISEQEFNRRVTSIIAFMLQPWTIAEPEADFDLDAHDRTKQMLIRPFLHRGNITMIQGQAKTGKTTIAVGLSALIVSGKHGKTLIEGAAITVPRYTKPGIVVYLAFDSNCANNLSKLKADAVRTYELDEKERNNLILRSMVGRGSDFKSGFHAIADEIRNAAEKQGTKNALSLIVIDTLSPLGEPTSAIHALESFSAEFPQAAILCLSHDNAEGGPNGGGRNGGKIYGACTHVIKLEKTSDGVHFSFAASNDGILPFDSDGFAYRIVDDHGKMEIVDPVRTEDDARRMVKENLMDAGVSAEECARQLGIASSALRTAVRRSKKAATSTK